MDIGITTFETLPLPQASFGASLTYADMYSIVEPSWLFQYYAEPISQVEKLESLNRFEVSRLLNPLPDVTHCISVSFFCKNNDSRDDRMLPEPSMDVGGHWYNKYFESFKKFLRDFHETPFFHNWKVRVYAEPKMLELLNNVASDRMELYIMAEDSVGSAPGTLWRFLAFGDEMLDVVYVADIDEALHPNIKYIDAFLADGNKSFGRLIHPPSANNFFVDGNKTSKNYAPIWGNRAACRPRLLRGLDVVSAMKAFVRMRMHGAKSETPWKVMPSDVANDYNASSPGNHPYGWGNHYHGYCFDERFLKHVVYPFVVGNGALQSWAGYDWRTVDNLNEEIKADLLFLAKHPNNTMVRVL